MTFQLKAHYLEVNFDEVLEQTYVILNNVLLLTHKYNHYNNNSRWSLKQHVLM
jgi:hypothetical protein